MIELVERSQVSERIGAVMLQGIVPRLRKQGDFRFSLTCNRDETAQRACPGTWSPTV